MVIDADAVGDGVRDSYFVLVQWRLLAQHRVTRLKPPVIAFSDPTSVRPDFTCEGNGRVIFSAIVRPKHDQNICNYMSDLRNTNKQKFSAALLVAFGSCEGIMLWMQD